MQIDDSGHISLLDVGRSDVGKLPLLTPHQPRDFPLNASSTILSGIDWGAVVAPYWYDVDTTAIGSGRIYYKNVTRGSDPDLTEVIDSLATRHLCGFTTTWALIVTWDHVGYYSERSDKVYYTYIQRHMMGEVRQSDKRGVVHKAQGPAVTRVTYHSSTGFPCLGIGQMLCSPEKRTEDLSEKWAMKQPTNTLVSENYPPPLPHDGCCVHVYIHTYVYVHTRVPACLDSPVSSHACWTEDIGCLGKTSISFKASCGCSIPLVNSLMFSLDCFQSGKLICAVVCTCGISTLHSVHCLACTDLHCLVPHTTLSRTRELEP